MCGLAGFVQPKGLSYERANQIGMKMADTLAHRGPDGVGIWSDFQSGTVLVHRRLALVDLSDAGQQPDGVRFRPICTYLPVRSTTIKIYASLWTQRITSNSGVVTLIPKPFCLH